MTDDDSLSVSAGYAQVTTEPIPLAVDVTLHAADAAVKLELLGDDDLPDGGIQTAAYLDADTARDLGERLLAAAEDLDSRHEAKP